MTVVFGIEHILKALAIHTQRNREVEITFTKQGYMVLYSSNEKGEKIRTIVTPEEIRDTNALHDFISEELGKREIPLKVTSKKFLGGVKNLLRLGG
ncbi:hypothetical protein PM10SUCC1_14860 [Propionigenium maris DSM 9537]|uniref:Uncharacterized protein n=1 Tax=Propionigenium maris DSM 9537 TaxID=1123000 RepID=A0A9W6GKN9_9FUSO|nr:hypothetical protein [Propionigenium maris]GLI55972.1 hypothetical protein PM10SUCC1_14860 [Propionigenium maris DSM 9537]